MVDGEGIFLEELRGRARGAGPAAAAAHRHPPLVPGLRPGGGARAARGAPRRRVSALRIRGRARSPSSPTTTWRRACPELREAAYGVMQLPPASLPPEVAARCARAARRAGRRVPAQRTTRSSSLGTVPVARGARGRARGRWRAPLPAVTSRRAKVPSTRGRSVQPRREAGRAEVGARPRPRAASRPSSTRRPPP